jgi:hypothetical protein
MRSREGLALGRYLRMPVDARGFRTLRASGVQNGGVRAVHATAHSDGGLWTPLPRTYRLVEVRRMLPPAATSRVSTRCSDPARDAGLDAGPRVVRCVAEPRGAGVLSGRRPRSKSRCTTSPRRGRGAHRRADLTISGCSSAPGRVRPSAAGWFEPVASPEAHDCARGFASPLRA